MTAPQPLAWPPTLDDLKRDLDLTDDSDDGVLTDQLAAALAHVIELRRDTVNFTGTPSTLPSPSVNLALGVVRLAGRWFTRRRSPDGLISNGELGSSRIPAYDADIERLCGIGRYAGPVFA